MAKREIMRYDGDKVPSLNLSFSVGLGGHNDKGDVMLLQAMFNLIALGTNNITSVLGVRSKSELPDLTGTLDSNTIFTIIAFQHRWLHQLYPPKSGWIFPADYKKELPATVGPERRQQMFMLHQLAQEAAARLNEADYTTFLPQEFPELKPYVKN